MLVENETLIICCPDPYLHRIAVGKVSGYSLVSDPTPLQKYSLASRPLPIERERRIPEVEVSRIVGLEAGGIWKSVQGGYGDIVVGKLCGGSK